MKDDIIGTYWLVADKNGKRSICQGNEPTSILGGWLIKSPTMGWISLDSDLHIRTMKGSKIVNKEDFKDLSFPKITYEESPVEIEIGKSGRVYTYES